MTTTFCPACRQPIANERAGIRLPAIKVRIFDCIKRAGVDGLLLDDVNRIVFDSMVKEVTIRNHIVQINTLLEETPFIINGENPKGFYRLINKLDIPKRLWRRRHAQKVRSHARQVQRRGNGQQSSQGQGGSHL